MWIEGKIKKEGCMTNNVSIWFPNEHGKYTVVAVWIERKIREERVHEHVCSCGFQMKAVSQTVVAMCIEERLGKNGFMNTAHVFMWFSNERGK